MEIDGGKAGTTLSAAIRVINRERVATAKAAAISRRDLECLAAVYKILGDPTRLKIVMALQAGEMCVGDLAAFLQMSASAVSHQLRRLYDRSLVKKRRDGQMLHYSLDDDHVDDLLRIGLEHVRE